MSDKLKQCREQIDALDEALLKIVNQRAALAQQIGHLKEGGVVLRPEREAQVLRRLQDANQGPLSNVAIAALFTEVMSQCRALEAPLSVAYLGPEGTFTEAAALKRFGSAVQGVSCATIDDVFRAVESGEVQYGVVPVENSTEGAIGRTLDLLLQSTLQVCGEVMLPIHQCLLAQQCDVSQIQSVYSHPQSLGQCQGWLNVNLPAAARIPVSSNAEAARLAAGHVNCAAIAGAQAAGHFGLNVCVENIEDDARNTTRFLVLGKQQVAASGEDKTSMVLSATNRPGAVHDLLASLAKYDVSMTKFESRPSRSGLWEYVFYVDIEGHQTDEKVVLALAELKQSAAFMKILGSYPLAV
ncbi:prephenate dehydratase [Gallionella capsiferriformans]|jgi:chorismate mutase/prephenate dehydratase|uniref:Bifunctional chorismate mutase/prephenate dehydratase n=1 Tax=Gallionella capsiferriformans (strain ES-2) TaxID=395494 RepID=D9SF70_GALCS|nr:prephenate dehydratase [Gallionella capsiferriformans]ADL55167.1 chorismate mutase [Gallionella capsiferriformans ES-2]